MAGKPSPHRPSISQLTPRLDPIPSVFRRLRRAKFQPHLGRHLSEFRQVLLDVGYPVTAVPAVGFEFEAQPTVDRDYNGNWLYRVK
jgi:hypothetical protein